MTHENNFDSVPEIKRPLSPYYDMLKQILIDADVHLVPTDRDLAPPDHHNDVADQD